MIGAATTYQVTDAGRAQVVSKQVKQIVPLYIILDRQHAHGDAHRPGIVIFPHRHHLIGDDVVVVQPKLPRIRLPVPFVGDDRQAAAGITVIDPIQHDARFLPIQFIYCIVGEVHLGDQDVGLPWSEGVVGHVIIVLPVLTSVDRTDEVIGDDAVGPSNS